MTELVKKWISLSYKNIPEKYIGSAAFLAGARWAERRLKASND